MASTPRPPSEAAPALASARRAVDELAEAVRPAWVDVDLDALEHNYRLLLPELGGRLLAVVKADAYGHGARKVGRALERLGVAWLGVALLEEGAELRQEGIERPILVMGTSRPAQLPLYARYRLTPTVSSLSQLAMWREWTAGRPLVQPVHLKVDTGMTRLGVAPDELPAALEAIRAHPQLELAGLASHFADADEPESANNPRQELLFAALLELLTGEERRVVEIHLANSAAALHRPAARHSLTRLGLALFGLDPADRRHDLAPVMSVSARLVQVREVPAGTALGYNSKRMVTRPSRIGVVPVGYADGYSWSLSDRAEALVGGRRVPVAGRVSMDMILVDLTGTGAAEGDEVVLLGGQGGEEISARELARLADSTPYEVLCSLGLRLSRRYRRGGVVESFVSRFARESA